MSLSGGLQPVFGLLAASVAVLWVVKGSNAQGFHFLVDVADGLQQDALAMSCATVFLNDRV